MHGEIKRGTKIICYLKEDQSEFLEDAAVLAGGFGKHGSEVVKVEPCVCQSMSATGHAAV